MTTQKKASAWIQAHFTTHAKSIEKYFKWKKFDAEIRDKNGELVYFKKGIKAPSDWSQLAVEIAASKYFRKTGLSGRKSGESSILELVQRVVGSIVRSGLEQKYFSPAEAKVFKRELEYILLSQRAWFNSPVWFNCGLFDRYKLNADAPLYSYDFKQKKIRLYQNGYEKPQVSACFIQSIKDDLEHIFEFAKNEARIFKYGSGSGTNFTNLRSKYEDISAGGKSSGLLAFLEVLDRGAGAIKSGGVTRRAAKMVCLDIDHPEVDDFIQWKMNEEKKAQALIRGGYSADFEGDAYKTISGQNSNNSVRLSDQFFKALKANSPWDLRSPKTGKKIRSVTARQLWSQIVNSAWTCADPGLQFDSIIQDWHTCPAEGKIRASNPCSEYMFVDDSACNLASLNLIAFDNKGKFEYAEFIHTAKIIFIAQEILVDLAGYPTSEIAKNSHELRPLGIGLAGLGGFLMSQGIAYDSDEGRSTASVLTAYLQATAIKTSAEMAKIKKPFLRFRRNKKSILRVVLKHQEALKKIQWTKVLEPIKTDLENLFSEAYLLSQKYGLRNAQFSVMAPTGTIGLVMDSDTTGIEPEFSLIKFKKLVGGGVLRIPSASVAKALATLGYSLQEQDQILAHLDKFGELETCPLVRDNHLPVFDCAQKNGTRGKRFLSPMAHLKMMAAIQPFISGAISKTVNMPADSSEKDVEEVFLKAWKLGLKAVAIYRDQSKASQPLNTLKTMEVCPECGSKTEIAGSCYRCTNCGFTTGCVS